METASSTVKKVSYVKRNIVDPMGHILVLGPVGVLTDDAGDPEAYIVYTKPNKEDSDLPLMEVHLNPIDLSVMLAVGCTEGAKEARGMNQLTEKEPSDLTEEEESEVRDLLARLAFVAGSMAGGLVSHTSPREIVERYAKLMEEHLPAMKRQGKEGLAALHLVVPQVEAMLKEADRHG